MFYLLFSAKRYSRALRIVKVYFLLFIAEPMKLLDGITQLFLNDVYYFNNLTFGSVIRLATNADLRIPIIASR